MSDTVRQLAKSVLSCTLLALLNEFGQVDFNNKTNVIGVVRWTSTVILLSACYYLQLQIWMCWRDRGRRRHTQPMESVDTFENVDYNIDNISVVWANTGLTMPIIWTYVYCWVIILFVTIYCLAGQNAICSCWWVVGMIALSLDELITRRVGGLAVCLVMLCLCGSVISIWSGALTYKGEFIGDLMLIGIGSPLLNFAMGVIFPVTTPFLFFTVRSIYGTRDVSRLCEFALPFMIVLAVGCLLGTDGSGHITRRFLDGNSSAMVESAAKFNPYYAEPDGVLILFAPFVVYWLIRVLIVSIITGHSTEFITAFLIVTSARYGMTNEIGLWSVLAVSGAGSAFVLLLLIRG